MKKTTSKNYVKISSAVIISISLCIFAGCNPFNQQFGKKVPIKPTSITANTMQITSSAFLNRKVIPAKYTCDGEGINPPLKITEVPKNAKSLVLIVDDPDAPSGDFVHWLVFDLKPVDQDIQENTAPANAIQGTNGAGQTSWFAPCPPSGIHRYQFKVYSLDTELKLPLTAKKSDVENAMKNHIIEQAILIGLFAKNQSQQ